MKKQVLSGEAKASEGDFLKEYFYFYQGGGKQDSVGIVSSTCNFPTP